MDFFRAIIGVIVIVGIAILLGKVKHDKHPELFTYTWVSSIVVLLLLRFFL